MKTPLLLVLSLAACAPETGDPFTDGCTADEDTDPEVQRTVAALLEAVDLPVGGDCGAAQDALLGLTHLDLKNRPDRLTTLAPLAGLTGLEVLELGDNRISDLSPLAGMQRLRALHLDVNAVEDLSPLEGLTALQELWLDRNPVADLSPLRGLTGLRRLDLAFTAAQDLAPLEDLTALEALGLGGAPVADLSPLSGLASLRELGIRGTQTTSLAPLAGLSALSVLDARGLGIDDLSPLAALSALQAVDLGDNRIRDLSAAQSWTALEEIALDGNPLEPTACAGLPPVAAAACGARTATPDASYVAFLGPCRQGSEAPVAARVTVEALLDVAGTEDCAAAAALLGTQTSLDLQGHVVPDLRPVQAFSRLETLFVDPDTVDPQFCPAGPGVAAPLAAVCAPLHAARLAETPLPDSFSAACEGTGPSQQTYQELRQAVNGRDCADTWRKLHPRSHLSLVDKGLTDLTPLSGLTNLRRLYLDYNDVDDLSPLADLTRLQVLWLDDNALTDLSAVAGMTHLLWLQAGDNPLSDLGPLSSLVHLRRLWLGGDAITDVSALAGLTRLHKLHLAVNQIEDLSPLAGMTRLETVYLAHNRITDATPLSGMNRLSLLSAGLDEEEDALQADRWFLAGNPIAAEQCPTAAPAPFKLRRFCSTR